MGLVTVQFRCRVRGVHGDKIFRDSAFSVLS
jgi:hypothetical protein